VEKTENIWRSQMRGKRGYIALPLTLTCKQRRRTFHNGSCCRPLLDMIDGSEVGCMVHHGELIHRWQSLGNGSGLKSTGLTATFVFWGGVEELKSRRAAPGGFQTAVNPSPSRDFRDEDVLRRGTEVASGKNLRTVFQLSISEGQADPCIRIVL
jgi:hypothetical protein